MTTYTMLNGQGFLEEADVESQAPKDQSSQVDFFTLGGRRDTLRRVHGKGDEDDQGDRESNYSSRRV